VNQLSKNKKIIFAVLAASAVAAVSLFFLWRGTGFYTLPAERLKSYPVEKYEVPPEAQWFTIDNARFGINASGGDARATTDGINEALRYAKESGYGFVRFERGTYLIQCRWNDRFSAPNDGILVPSGLTLDLSGSVFLIEPNGSPCYCVFGIVGQSGVRILGGTLIGDREGHVYSPDPASPSHEWGFGICVCASGDITIQDVTIIDMTGDGIIVEGSYKAVLDGGTVSSGVSIYGCDISNCRRQGISVVGAVNGEIAQNTIHGINGTEPQSGIDLEPEFDHPVSGFKIYQNLIYGCAGGSIICHGGSDYSVFANKCHGGSISAVMCSGVEIYDNIIESGFIRIYRQAADTRAYNNQFDLFSRFIQGR